MSVAYAHTNSSDDRISKDYRALLLGLENKVLTDTKFVIGLDDIRNISKDRIIFTIQTESEIIKYCEMGEKEKALYCLKNVIETNYSDNENVFTSLKYALSVTIKRILLTLNISEIDFFGKGYYFEEEIINADNHTTLLHIMKEIIEMICESVGNETLNENFGKKIIDYIDDNLSKDISISDVADVLNVSVSYISKVLRSEYNTTFKTYIDEKRVKVAKKMMDEDKDILIKDVAFKLGYNNVVSFIRMFKKVEGMSPGAYHKMK